jgi:hypothetical protein
MQQANDAARRLEERFSADGVTAEIDGTVCTLRDWSARGFALADYDREHERGTRLRTTVRITDEAGDRTFEAGLFVVSADPETGTLAAVFVDYGRETALILDAVFPTEI